MRPLATNERGGLSSETEVARDRRRSHGQRFPRWLAGFTLPLECWSGRHRLLAYVSLAAIAFAGGVQGWRSIGIGAAAANGAALAELERRFDDARATLARLPAMKKALSGRASLDTTPQSATAQWQAVSSLVERSGMTLTSLEPGALVRDGIRTARALRFAAHGDFASFFAFLRALRELPSLAVPVALRLEPAKKGLAIDVTLQLYSALLGDVIDSDAAVAAAMRADDAAGRFADPFAGVPGLSAGTGTAEIRLVGLMHEKVRARGLALLETADGVGAYWPGQAIGIERIASIDARGVTLMSGERRRVMRLEKERVS